MKKKAIIISSSLGLIYIIALCCGGIFGASVAAWFMLWVPTVVKILLSLLGLAVVIVLPIRVQQALELRKARIDTIIKARQLAVAEAKAKKLEQVATIAQRVNRYE